MKDRDEDSGLHDIRSLASSTKMRLSSRRSTQNPVINEDDVLASSSAGWKAVALPEPAKMVSLPELASLPTKAEIEALDREARAKTKAETKAEKAAEKAEAKAKKVEAAAAPALTEAAAPAVEAPAMPSIGSRIAAQKSGGGKGKMLALVGVGLAAAAGAAVFVMTKKNDSSTSVSYESKAAAPIAERTAKQLPSPPPAQPAIAADTAAAAGSAAPVEEVAPAPAPEPAKVEAPKGKDKDKADKVHKVEIRDTIHTQETKPADKPVAPPKEEKKANPDDGEPSFDALLKEAGVSDQKKEVKPVLAKKSLSGADIKTGMSSVAGKAQACYQGTQGTAQVKLTVAPSGQVTKVSVSGAFAGTPVAACVEAAVRSATFPPWDGGPQSFGYSYLLAE